MSSTFVVRNQLGQFWGKKKKWVDGTAPKRVLVCKHEDEGVNLLVELSAKDIDLRGEVAATEVNEKGVPQVESSAHLIVDEPEPTLEPEEAEAETTSEEAAEEPESTTD